MTTEIPKTLHLTEEVVIHVRVIEGNDYVIFTSIEGKEPSSFTRTKNVRWIVEDKHGTIVSSTIK